MKKTYLEPSLYYCKLTEDVLTASCEKPTKLGDGDWGVEDDFI